jgi:hypothetical protein
MTIQSEVALRIPNFGERLHKPGLYLELQHGREHPTQPMNGWGFDGPLIGPLNWCHTIYATTVRIEFQSVEDELQYFDEACFPDARDMEIFEDLLVHNGKYYGDWTVFILEPATISLVTMPNDTFRKVHRRGDRTKRAHTPSQEMHQTIVRVISLPSKVDPS